MGQGDAAIARRDEALNLQSAEVERWRLLGDRANAAARAAAADAEVARQAAAARAVEVYAWAAANPDKVCKLSPELRARAEALFK